MHTFVKPSWACSLASALSQRTLGMVNRVYSMSNKLNKVTRLSVYVMLLSEKAVLQTQFFLIGASVCCTIVSNVVQVFSPMYVINQSNNIKQFSYETLLRWAHYIFVIASLCLVHVSFYFHEWLFLFFMSPTS